MTLDLLNNECRYEWSDYFKPAYKDEINAFWKQTNLYDDVELFGGVKSVVASLSKFTDIVFISSCVDEHTKSKRDFIERYFPYARFVSTYDKGLIDVDVMIDDRNDVLNQFDDSVGKIKVITPYTQEEDLRDVSYSVTKDKLWKKARISEIEWLLGVDNE